MAGDELHEVVLPPGVNAMRLETLRDSIALEVMKGVLANPEPWLQWAIRGKDDAVESALARWSYRIADAMMTERSMKIR